jgi:hypothetical protein
MMSSADVRAAGRENAQTERHTIRLDYVLSGAAGERTDIALVKTSRLMTDNCRRVNMTRPLLAGAGRVSLIDDATGDTLYVNTFSTLFQEWKDLNDSVRRAFEATFLIPEPERAARVSVELFDKRHKTVASHSHRLAPSDILIRDLNPSPWRVDTLHRATSATDHIAVAIAGEGYRADDMERFLREARRAVDAILSHEPFKRYADRFDFYAVEVESTDSGVSVPKEGRWIDTPFGSHFSTFYSDRYLTSPCVFAIHDALTGIPYQHIIVLANTDVYGGGGIFNSYTLTAAGHRLFEPVVVHEFGHSFGGLADEYFYDDDVMTDTYVLDVEPWEPNITTLVDYDSKWKDMDGAALFEGGGYSAHGIYRPADTCRMRANQAPAFCPACQRALSRMILFYTE